MGLTTECRLALGNEEIEREDSQKVYHHHAARVLQEDQPAKSIPRGQDPVVALQNKHFESSRAIDAHNISNAIRFSITLPLLSDECAPFIDVTRAQVDAKVQPEHHVHELIERRKAARLRPQRPEGDLCRHQNGVVEHQNEYDPVPGQFSVACWVDRELRKERDNIGQRQA